MKHLKAKLMAAVAMLLVATVMLTSASFAWFTISTAPEVTDLTTQVVVNENLEIALLPQATAAPTAIPAAAAVGDSYDSSTVNTKSAYKWGNLVDLGSTNTGDEAVTNYTALTKTVRPATLASTTTTEGVTTEAGTYYYPVYGDDGRITTLSALKEGKVTDSTFTNQYGFGNLVVDADNTSEDGKVYGYYVDYWVRSNISGKLALSTAAKRSSNGEDGGGSIFTTAKAYIYDTDGTTITGVDADHLSALAVLADNIKIAFKDITPANVDGAAVASSTATPVAAEGTKTAVTEKISGTDTVTGYTTAFKCDEIISLTANQAKLIRVYVYLEGKDVTNAAASLDDFSSNGSLNIQFKLTDGTNTVVNTSMDATSVS